MGSNEDEALRGLLEAVRLSPDNRPLRQHVAKLLLQSGRATEAVEQLRAAVRLAPSDEALRLELAEAFLAAGKHGESLVILEDQLRLDAAPARARLVLARALRAAGQLQRARDEYRKAVAADPKLRDDALELSGEDGMRQRALRAGAAEGAGAEAVESGEDEGAEREDEPALRAERSEIDFRHVGGLAQLKEEIRIKILAPIQHPELFKAYGKKAGGGILLYGPPGCGKTHLARATAGELAGNFLAVGIHDVLDMWIGNSEKNLHGIFELARRSTPCVLFFDEVDALAASRADMRTSSCRHLINQFLSELDGLTSDNEGMLVLGATNAPWHLDNAFRRPGRFDRVLFVPPPDAAAREAILDVLLAGKPAEEVDTAKVAAKTERFSGADLGALVDAAIESKLRAAIRSGAPKPLETKDLLEAAKLQKPTTSEWFRVARNYLLYANESGLYDDLKPYLDR